MKKILSILLFFFVTNFAQAIEYTHCFTINDEKIFLETAVDKAKGLMGRDHLLPNAGMVFFYPSYEEECFWMKNTKIPLDIIFLKDGTVTRVYKNAEPCITDICRVYPSKGVVNQVIEVNAGFCKKYKIKKGSAIWVQELTN
jgi:uncharacterized membrane protein (UPF0127 family)